MDTPDINVLLSQMAEMQKQLNDLQSLKKDVKEIKEISSIGEDVAKEVAEEVRQLQENGVVIPHLEKQAEDMKKQQEILQQAYKDMQEARGKVNELDDKPEIRGMLARVPHLVKVEEI